MSTREQRIEVFNDTQNWINQDKTLSDSVAYSKAHTKIFYEDDYPKFNRPVHTNMTVNVTMDRSFQAAMRLHHENNGSKIAVMNFANAFHAGGGVTKGSSAQEECLCRTSTLYPLLYRRTLRDSFYKHHNDMDTPKASDSLIYTEDVIICKSDEDLPKRLSQDDWVTVDVITVAAPDLRSKSNMHADLVGGGVRMNNAELYAYHVKRAIHVLTCAAAMGADILVLGAFGCGAFENDPNVVALAYKNALSVFPNVFSIIEFAVYCNPSNTTNYEVFSHVLGDGWIAEKNKHGVNLSDENWGEDYLGMSENYYDRPAQIPVPRERFDYLMNRYSPGDYEKWVIFHYFGHFMIYDKETKKCLYDVSYIEQKDSKLAAVITTIRINMDNHSEDTDDDFGFIARLFMEC